MGLTQIIHTVEGATDSAIHMTDVLLIASNFLVFLVTAVLIGVTVHEMTKAEHENAETAAKTNRVLARLVNTFIKTSSGAHKAQHEAGSHEEAEQEGEKEEVT